MTVRLDGGVIRLEGVCHLEDAEVLIALLQTHPEHNVDVSACGSLHGAVAQVIMAMRPVVVGTPQSPFLRNLLLPALVVEGRHGPTNL